MFPGTSKRHLVVVVLTFITVGLCAELTTVGVSTVSTLTENLTSPDTTTATTSTTTEALPDFASIELNLTDAVASVGRLFEYRLASPDVEKILKISQVTEAGKETLPDWLYFNETSCILSGVAGSDVQGSIYFLEVVAECKFDTDGCLKLQEIFSVIVQSELDEGPSNLPPSLLKPIDEIQVNMGQYFEFHIAPDVFYDKEDGNTKYLSLSLMLPFSENLPSDFWLQLNQTSQTIIGLPLADDIDASSASSVTLVATDSAGLTSKDAIQFNVKAFPESSITHHIIFRFNQSFGDFKRDRMNIINLVFRISSFLEEPNPDFIQVSNVENGSVVLDWGNNKTFGDICDRDTIASLYDQMAFSNGTVNPSFADHLLPDFILVSSELVFVGACLHIVTMTPPLPTKEGIVQTSDFDVWAEVILPALAAVLLLVIIVFVILIICRRRRSAEKTILKADKPIFMEDRRPIIFPDELEVEDPTLKPKNPLVLPVDVDGEKPPESSDGFPYDQDLPAYQIPTYIDNVFFKEHGQTQRLPPAYGSTNDTNPPPYRLPPPYFPNPGTSKI